MSYPGTYLKTKPFEKRYEIVGNYLKDKVKKPVVVDINCGEPLFKNYIDYKEYYANDVYKPDDDSGINFALCTDTDVDIKPDVLCIFGYGGGEFTGQPLESHTSGKTIRRLAKYKPEYIVIEMAQKWEEDFKIMSGLIKDLIDYNVVLEEKIDLGSHYHDKRYILILKKITYEN